MSKIARTLLVDRRSECQKHEFEARLLKPDEPGSWTYLVVNRELCEAAWVERGDSARVVLQKDMVERTVEVPKALRRALDGDAEAKTAFERLSYSRKKEYAQWISEAKQEQTRARRIAKALAMLREGKTLK